MSQASVMNNIKVWVFPSLVTIIGTLIWQEISEIKSDVKALLAQSNIDKTRIDNLERQVYSATDNNKPTKVPQDTVYHEAILPDNKINLFAKR